VSNYRSFQSKHILRGDSMLKKWLFLFALVTLLLAACTRPPATSTSRGGITVTPTSNASVSLTALPGEVSSGSSAILSIRVEAGTVSTVDVAVKGSRPFVVNIALPESGSYTFTSPVITETTTFEVTAKDISGAVAATAETTVQVTGAESTSESEATLPEVPAPAPTPDPVETTLPEGTVRVGSLEELQAATAAESTATTIMVVGTIICDADPCVRLKAGQTLMGAGETPAALNADRSGDGDLSTVIELAPDTSVVNLELNGPDIYTAINGVDAELSGTILVRNVTITGPTANAPLAVRETATSGTYTLILDGLTVTETARSIGISNFSQLEVINSTFNLNITENSRGLIFQTGGVGSVLLDGVTVNSGIASESFTPVTFTNIGAEGTLAVTMTNTSVAFPSATPEALATARSFIFEVTTDTGKIAVQTPTSVGNTTQATSPVTVVYDVPEGVDPAVVIFGYAQGTLGDGSAFPER
jgi:hypothetical protein